MEYNDEILESVFDDTYNSIYNKLFISLKSDNFEIQEIEQQLEALYQYDGMAWTGRADIKQSEIEGQILAYQAFIKRYKEGTLKNE